MYLLNLEKMLLISLVLKEKNIYLVKMFLISLFLKKMLVISLFRNKKNIAYLLFLHKKSKSGEHFVYFPISK